LWDDQGIAVGEKDSALTLAIAGCKFDILLNDRFWLNSKTHTFVRATECTLVVGTSLGNLKDDAVCLARRPDDDPLIVHYPVAPKSLFYLDSIATYP